MGDSMSPTILMMPFRRPMNLSPGFVTFAVFATALPWYSGLARVLFLLGIGHTYAILSH